VEDNDLSREWVAILLRRAGYHVAPAANGEEGLRLLRGGRPVDLILLDMLMPVLDGWHFLGRLQRDADTFAKGPQGVLLAFQRRLALITGRPEVEPVGPAG
jgi:CheY-like chemotaxis protein